MASLGVSVRPLVSLLCRAPQMEAVQELVDVISMQDFLEKESKNLGKLPPANLLEKPADLWNFFEVVRLKFFLKHCCTVSYAAEENGKTFGFLLPVVFSNSSGTYKARFRHRCCRV